MFKVKLTFSPILIVHTKGSLTCNSNPMLGSDIFILLTHSVYTLAGCLDRVYTPKMDCIFATQLAG